MKTTYWSLGGFQGQSTDATLVAVIGSKTFRVTIHWDRSYAFQSRGEIAVLDGNKFETVLYLHHHDLARIADHDRMDPPKRGEAERAGKLPGLMRKQADELAELGAKIVGS